MTTVLCVFFSMLAVGVSSGIHLAERKRQVDRCMRLTLAEIDRERAEDVAGR